MSGVEIGLFFWIAVLGSMMIDTRAEVRELNLTLFRVRQQLDAAEEKERRAKW